MAAIFIDTGRWAQDTVFEALHDQCCGHERDRHNNCREDVRQLILLRAPKSTRPCSTPVRHPPQTWLPLHAPGQPWNRHLRVAVRSARPSRSRRCDVRHSVCCRGCAWALGAGVPLLFDSAGLHRIVGSLRSALPAPFVDLPCHLIFFLCCAADGMSGRGRARSGDHRQAAARPADGTACRQGGVHALSVPRVAAGAPTSGTVSPGIAMRSRSASPRRRIWVTKALSGDRKTP